MSSYRRWLLFLRPNNSILNNMRKSQNRAVVFNNVCMFLAAICPGGRYHAKRGDCCAGAYRTGRTGPHTVHIISPAAVHAAHGNQEWNGVNLLD